MATNSLVTAHMIVRNEEYFIGYAIASIIKHVDKILIYDTGSTDSTVSVIKSFSSSKIHFEQKGLCTRKQLAQLRNEQVQHTRTPWMLNVDGDEIYPQKTIKEIITIMRTTPKSTIGIVIPFYNWVGDLYHVQKESAGRYRFGNRVGHLNLRGIKVSKQVSVKGEYPNEAYTYKNIPVQNYTNQLVFARHKFFHAGNLTRSSQEKKVFERHLVYDMGIPKRKPLPEVMINLPSQITQKRTLFYTAIACSKIVLKKAWGNKL